MTVRNEAYRPDIDGLRALSILLVVAYHAFPQALPGGYVGVDVFFVISGYLITGQICSQAAAGRFSFAAFYARRVRRIFPPLIVVLACAGAYGYVRMSLGGFQSLYGHIAASTAFLSNVLLWRESGYFDSQAEFKPLLHLWSLAIEEQFYLLWPMFVVALMAWAHRHRRALGLGLAALCAVSFLAGIVLVAHDPVAAFYSPASRVWELGMGGLLAALRAGHAGFGVRRWNPRVIEVAAAAGTASLVACAVLLSGQSPYPGALAAIPTLSAVAIIAAGPGAAINRHLFASAPMVGLGLVSYGLYLWHWPLLSIMRIEGAGRDSIVLPGLVIASSVALAALMRFALEQPIRRSASRATTAALVAVVALIGAVAALGNRGVLLPDRFAQQANAGAAAAFDAKGIAVRDCTGLVPRDSLAFRFCRDWGNPASSRLVAVWGDSMSDTWMAPFLTLARDEGWRILQFSHAACPPMLGVHRTGASIASAWCNDATLQSQVMDAIRRARPDATFLIARWNLYYAGYVRDGVLVERSFVTDGPGAANRESAQAAFQARLPETIEALSAIGRVVVFKETPVLRVSIDLGLAHRPNSFEPTVEEHARLTAGVNLIIDAAALRIRGASSFDPAARLCDASRCSAFLDGMPAYSDDAHLTPAATLRYLPEVRRLGTAP